MSHDLPALFAAERGIVCAVGAGGKKSTLYRLAAACPEPLALTATVGTTVFPGELGLTEVIETPAAIEAAVLAQAGAARLAYAAPRDKPGRLAGLPPELVAGLHERTGRRVSLVKADGARMRWLKTHKPGEPVLPPGCRTVIAMLSARAFGQPLTERVAHRLERVCAVTGATPGEPVTPEIVARLFSAPGGLLDGLAAPTIVPVLNMVDDDALAVSARQTAELVLASTTGIRRFILASMRRADDPVVAVIEP
jgi:probable selenium-dependent hydroxylase accessory protein YqeC